VRSTTPHVLSGPTAGPATPGRLVLSRLYDARGASASGELEAEEGATDDSDVHVHVERCRGRRVVVDVGGVGANDESVEAVVVEIIVPTLDPQDHLIRHDCRTDEADGTPIPYLFFLLLIDPCPSEAIIEAVGEASACEG
jgi:hypothetical protein